MYSNLEIHHSESVTSRSLAFGRETNARAPLENRKNEALLQEWITMQVEWRADKISIQEEWKFPRRVEQD